MWVLKWIAYRLPVLGRVLAQRNDLHAANEALAVRVQELEATRREALGQCDQANAERWAAVRQREDAEAARWEAVRQREGAEAVRWEAVRAREAADAERGLAIKQREAADAERGLAIKQREAADAERGLAIRQREAADAERGLAIRQREAADAERGLAIRLREAADAERAAAIKQRDAAESALADAKRDVMILPTPKAVGWEDCAGLEKQGLFIVGHARSGTTALLRALNMSPDLYLLGEANLSVEGLKTGFARWYNDMHRADGQTEAKFTFCPVAPRDDANGVETLQWLGERFRYVGEKVAFRSESLGYDPVRFFEFHARYFFTSHYLCVIRNPIDTLKSSEDLFKPDNLSIYAESYLRVLELVLALYDTFPNVQVLFHEWIDQETFDRIGERLGVDLGGFYEAAYHTKFQVVERWGSDHADIPAIDVLKDAHRRMREAFSVQTLREIPNHPQWQVLAQSIRTLRMKVAG